MSERGSIALGLQGHMAALTDVLLPNSTAALAMQYHGILVAPIRVVCMRKSSAPNRPQA